MRDAQGEMAIAFGIGIVRDRPAADEADLEALYDLYADSLFRFAMTFTRCVEDAEDAVQEVFVRVARESNRLSGVGAIKPYLFAAVRNAALGVLRSRRRRDNLHEAVCFDFPTSHFDREDHRCVDSQVAREAFELLPIEQREVLVLKIYEEMTFQEIAQAVHASQNTVASRYRYGIEKLKRALEAQDDG